MKWRKCEHKLALVHDAPRGAYATWVLSSVRSLHPDDSESWARGREMPAIVTVDLQHDFCDERCESLGRVEKTFCLPGVRRLLTHARAGGWKVIHVATQHSGVSTLPRRLRDRAIPPFCLQATDGARLIEGIRESDEPIVWKHSFSGFVGTNLEAELVEHNSVVVCGVATDCCVQHTVFDAAERLQKVVAVPIDGTSAANAAAQIVGLKNIEKSAGLTLMTDALIRIGPDEWSHQSVAPSTIDALVEEHFRLCRDAVSDLAPASDYPDVAHRIAAIEKMLTRTG